MHDTASRIGGLAIETYLSPGPARILEIGSYDVNGSLRSGAPERAEYVGLDVEAGPGVDLVVEPGGSFPVDDDSFDLVVATSALEHDPAFWSTFLEMCRKVRNGGYVYINVPSNGAVHRFPQDNWRFYPDSGRALAAWARSQGLDIHLVESFTAMREADIWNDFVAVFRKSPSSSHLPDQLLHTRFVSSNVWVEHAEKIQRETTVTEDMALLQTASDRLGASETRLSEVRAELEGQLGDVRAQLEAERAGLAAVEHELAQARAESVALTGRLAEVQSELAQRQEEIAQTTAEHDHTRAERDHARAELELSRERVTRLREEIAEANSWVFKLAGERQEAESRCARLTTDLAAAERLYASESAAHARAAAELIRTRAVLAESRGREQDEAKQRARLEAELADLRHHSAGLQTQVDALSGRAAGLEAQVGVLQAHAASLVEAHADAVAENQRTTAQLGERYHEIATLTGLLVAQEGATGEQAERAEWLRQIAALSVQVPFWWYLLPAPMRRRRELRRLAQRGLFDGHRYHELHPDVREAGMDPLRHYLLHGLSEGRAV